jgi:hypothetical protein
LTHAKVCELHDALRDPLAIEARELLEQVVILQQRRAAGPGGL